MKNTELDQVDDRRRKQSLQKLYQEIKRIESVIKNLLDGVDISELTTEKRLVIGARIISLHQRAVALRHAFELDQPENRQNLEMARLMRLMRGEPEVETSEAVRIVDVTDDAGSLTTYRETPFRGRYLGLSRRGGGFVLCLTDPASPSTPPGPKHSQIPTPESRETPGLEQDDCQDNLW